MSGDVSEELAASIFCVEELAKQTTTEKQVETRATLKMYVNTCLDRRRHIPHCSILSQRCENLKSKLIHKIRHLNCLCTYGALFVYSFIVFQIVGSSCVSCSIISHFPQFIVSSFSLHCELYPPFLFLFKQHL